MERRWRRGAGVGVRTGLVLPAPVRMVALLAGLTTSLLAVGCTQSVLSPDGGGDPDLVGRWIWTRSTGGIAGTTRTPATEGFEGVLQFRSDRTVEWRVDGQLAWSTTWSLGVGEEGSPLAGRDVVRYGEPVVGWDLQAVGIENGRLILTDPCCDGFVHEYLRGGP